MQFFRHLNIHLQIIIDHYNNHILSLFHSIVFHLNIYLQIFEGEYLDGIRNGKGKEYDYYGQLLFEGEYLNGKRWNGKEKVYNDVGELLFEGEYLNGLRNRK